MTALYALTLHQPWAAAIVHAGKRVENRTWMTHHRGLVAIHAGASVDSLAGEIGQRNVDRIADLSGLSTQKVWQLSDLRSAVVAVATLTGVCHESRYRAFASPLLCDCGPWAASQQRHFLLADVRVLPTPVPCGGHQKLWSLPDPVDAAVRAQLDLERAA